MIDLVNHPPHYVQGSVECIHAIKSALSEEGYIDWLRGQVIKYMWRMPHKDNPLQDTQKAAYYLSRLEEVLSEDQGTAPEIQIHG